jgi:LPXTG-site transpeptidase (sortase) family protein
MPAPTAPPASEPVAISIPRLGTHADIVPLGMESDGTTMAAPSDPDTVGWYDFSARVGVPGNAVVVGHVDWGGRLRAFGLLRQLRVGDAVDVSDSLERQFTYRVTSTSVVPLDAPPAEFLTQSGPFQELTLITCGGAFDHARHQYLSRVIVRAVRDDDARQAAEAAPAARQ